jgi:hypothetical protein
MSFKINENKKQIKFVSQTITDCTHLIDLPAAQNIFDQKQKGNDVSHPKAEIKILTVFYYKNGLSNLL